MAKKNTIKKEIFSLEKFVDGFPAPSVSFEFFPPTSDKAEKDLWETIKELEPLNPEFVSVTYGARGSSRERTQNTVFRIIRETKLKLAAHITCIDSTRAEIDELAERYWDEGVRRLIAIRGDHPKDRDKYVPNSDGYKYASDLVAGLRNIGDFDISVAAFPEGNPESVGIEEDLYHLQQKIDAGATSAITQFFFDPNVYFEFVEKARKANINIPIIPGILVISNYERLVKFCKDCSVKIPDWITKLLAGMDSNPRARDRVATAINSEICRRLRQDGVDRFHFYTMNKAPQVHALCQILGIK